MRTLDNMKEDKWERRIPIRVSNNLRYVYIVLFHSLQSTRPVDWNDESNVSIMASMFVVHTYTGRGMSWMYFCFLAQVRVSSPPPVSMYAFQIPV